MKACPFCAEEIQDAAIVCKHCKRELEPKPIPLAATSQVATPQPALPASVNPQPTAAQSMAKGCLSLIGLSILVAFMYRECGRVRDVRNHMPPPPAVATRTPSPAATLTPEALEKQRRANLAAGIVNARAVISDKAKCEMPGLVSAAWAGVRLVSPQDGERKQIVALLPKLEACREKAVATLFRDAAMSGVPAREAWAAKAERVGLDSNMDMEFTLVGDEKDDLRVKWALMGKVAVHQLTKAGSMEPGAFLRQVQDVGFSKVTFTDGYRFFDTRQLAPPQRHAAATAIVQQDLHVPFVLPATK